MWLLKLTLIWVLLLVVAMATGSLREFLLAPRWGEDLALPVSGLLLALLVFLVTWLLLPWVGHLPRNRYLLAGLYWLLLTLAFEILFVIVVLQDGWQVIFSLFHIASGNLFSLVLLALVLSPWLVARIRGL